MLAENEDVLEIVALNLVTPKCSSPKAHHSWCSSAIHLWSPVIHFAQFWFLENLLFSSICG